MHDIDFKKISSLFEDPAFGEEVRGMITSNETGSVVIETLTRILDCSSSIESVLEELIERAYRGGHQVDIPMSQAFFVLSEISTLKKEYRDLALDTSLMLGEDDESRVDRKFDPMSRFIEIKSTIT